MVQREFTSLTKSIASLAQATLGQCQEVPKPQRLLQPDPLARVITLAGHTGSPQTHAAVLNRATRGQLSRAGHSLLQLQRQYGNHYVQRVVDRARHPLIQPKLVLGPAGDQYEQEADRVARQVVERVHTSMNQPASQAVQRQEEEDELQLKPSADSLQRQEEEDEDEVRMKPAGQRQLSGEGTAVSSDVEAAIQGARGSGQPLPNTVRGPMEQALGADFSGVRVHTDARADQLNRSLQARAFTTGQDIFLRQGAYNPGSATGQELLAHELTHVVQQAGRGTPTIQRRIGFEIETGIPVMEETSDTPPTYGPLDNDELEAPVPGGKLMVDHLPKHPNTATEPFNEWNIIEFVSNPLNENMKDNAFRATVRPWIQNLQTLQTFAQNHFEEWPNVPGVGAAKTNNIWMGLQPGTAAYPYWDRVAPQATMGIKLKKVGAVLGQARTGGFPGQTRYERVASGAHQAAPMADRVMTYLLAQYPPTWSREKGINSLRGLLTLICNYLLSGAATGTQGYIKNRTVFMYKSKLSSVRNDVVQEYYGGKILNNAGRQAQVRNRLLHETHRNATDEVFNGVGVECRDWIDEVLAGQNDTLFETMKNPWSQEIVPENVGGKKAAIMEMRDITEYGILGVLDLSNVDGIVQYLRQVYRLNRQWSK